MTIKEMTLSEKSLLGGGQGVTYNLVLDLSGDVTSDAYSIPEINVNSIGVVVGGDDAGDVIVTTYGVHYAIDTLGSRQINDK